MGEGKLLRIVRYLALPIIHYCPCIDICGSHPRYSGNTSTTTVVSAGLILVLYIIERFLLSAMNAQIALLPSSAVANPVAQVFTGPSQLIDGDCEVGNSQRTKRVLSSYTTQYTAKKPTQKGGRILEIETMATTASRAC